LEVRCWPYRDAGTNWWALNAESESASIRLRLAETGVSRLPFESLKIAAGEAFDAVDAYYLFEFIKQELSPPPDDMPR
jgi:hypothetical protein